MTDLTFLYDEMKRIGYRIEQTTDQAARGVPGSENRLYACATDLHNLALLIQPKTSGPS